MLRTERSSLFVTCTTSFCWLSQHGELARGANLLSLSNQRSVWLEHLGGFGEIPTVAAKHYAQEVCIDGEDGLPHFVCHEETLTWSLQCKTWEGVTLWEVPLQP